MRAAQLASEGASIGNAAATCHPHTSRACKIGIAIRRVVRSTGMACLLVAAAAGGIVHAQGDDLATEQATIADCDSTGFQVLLAPMQAVPADARAYWLDRTRLQWPGAKAGARFRLYHARQPRIVAQRGARVAGADGALLLAPVIEPLPDALATRYKFIGKGAVLALAEGDASRLPALLRQQLVLAQEDDEGRVLDATTLQPPGALDDVYADAAKLADLGAQVDATGTAFRLWAPTARAVALCLHDNGTAAATALHAMRLDVQTGAWSLRLPRDLSSQYYTYLVDVFVPGVGLVRNRVTDPYSISLTTDSRRSWIGDLDADALKPAGWDTTSVPDRVHAQTDMVVYELHVRDFSIGDASVRPAHRGKYLAFTDTGSDGMRHLRALAEAGVTDVHLLPVFDFATVPEGGCTRPRVDAQAAPDSERQQAAVMAVAGRDCFNWGYDPYHFNAPEGSYATDAADGGTRILEFRRMVMALHQAGLRVGMDVVYNHTSVAGQQAHSVLDRIVPGYYQRLDANGAVEHSTCCANTATEHLMMGKLMADSVAQWARAYRIDSFRFDLMGHQPRPVMEALQARVDAEAGRHVNLIGEGWNFGEVADGARFVQASQLSLNGSGIGTFSDRARDALRGGSAGDNGEALVRDQGWLNGLVYAPNAMADPQRPRADLLHAADFVRVGLAGSLSDYVMTSSNGIRTTLSAIDYDGQPAGYVSEPAEVVNYVENHDNQTLFDIDALRLPRDTSREDRARVQLLGAAIVALSQGVAYYHAGIDTLRSKSLDRNSFDSGDWFNRLDWTYRDNHFGTGAPPAGDNGKDYALLKPLLADPGIKPTTHEIAWMRDAFRDLLRIRASSSLFRLRTAADIEHRLRLLDTGPAQTGTLVAGHLDGNGHPGAGFAEVLYLVNADAVERRVVLPGERSKAYVLHPVQRAPDAADRRPAEAARYDARSGSFSVPARTAVVYVVAASADDAARHDDPATAATTDTLALAAPGVSPRPMNVHVHLPPGYAHDATTRYPVLYINDGQDWDAVGINATLAQLYRDGAMQPVIVVAIDMPPDRMGAYGLSNPGAHRSLVANTRYGPVGAIADAYSRWVVERLVPHVDAHYRTRPDPADRTVLGWSLGALNAFNLGWQYPQVFGRVGAFSPSFWVSSERQDDTVSMRTRLAQRMVDHGDKREGARFWFAIGDSEDTDDRDGDGLNDAVDDLRDLILGYRADDGFRTRGLVDLGYTTDMAAAEHAPRDAEVAYFLLRNGHHNQDAWKRMLPPFLAWAFGDVHPQP